MNRFTNLLALLGIASLGMMASAQSPVSVPLPAQQSAALLYVRFTGPKGMHVGLYQGRAMHSFETPITIGFRPGYVYRVKITGIGSDPTAALYPTLEIGGSLALTPQVRPADYPAPAVFDGDALEHALAGMLVTKVVYLEHPDFAMPVATKPDQPLEIAALRERDPVSEARLLGRPVMIVRFGERQWTDRELAEQAIPNTVLLPGEHGLSAAAAPPRIPWANVPVYDPIAGPKPAAEECLHDGGDTGRRAGFDANGRLAGVDPSDSVAEYRDSKGTKRISVSNRVCICVPRYAIIRAEYPLAENAGAVGVGDFEGAKVQDLLRSRVPSLSNRQMEHLSAMKGRKRASENRASVGVDQIFHLDVLNAMELDVGAGAVLGTKEAVTLSERQRTALQKQWAFARSFSQQVGLLENAQLQGTVVTGRLKGLDVIEAQAETRDFSCLCGEAPHTPEKPLVLCKWADKQAAQVGDIVAFTIKYSNLGGQPITDVAVADSLSPRLEYVAGSAQSDRNAVFTIQANEAGSAILRWEVSGMLLPGQAGIVRFQARVR